MSQDTDKQCRCICHSPAHFAPHKEGHGCCPDAVAVEDNRELIRTTNIHTPTDNAKWLKQIMQPILEQWSSLDEAYAEECVLPSNLDDIQAEMNKAKTAILTHIYTAYETGYSEGGSSSNADWISTISENLDIECTGPLDFSNKMQAHIDTVCREAEERARYSERKIMTLQAIDTKLLESKAQKIQFEVHMTDNCKRKHDCAFASDGESFSVAMDGRNIISRQLNPNKDTE